MLSEGQFGMPSVDGESFYSSSSTSGASSGGGEGGGNASAGASASGGSGSGDGDSGSGLKLIRLEEVSKIVAKRDHTRSGLPRPCCA